MFKCNINISKQDTVYICVYLYTYLWEYMCGCVSDTPVVSRNLLADVRVHGEKEKARDEMAGQRGSRVTSCS